ncbi:hypothetical protein [Pseudomonas sp. BN417]|nr:hypothetical protein [Pseudomonas sp. BN417]
MKYRQRQGAMNNEIFRENDQLNGTFEVFIAENKKAPLGGAFQDR